MHFCRRLKSYLFLYDKSFEVKTYLNAVSTSLEQNIFSYTDYTGLQRNWDKHKNTRLYLIWGCWI